MYSIYVCGLRLHNYGQNDNHNYFSIFHDDSLIFRDKIFLFTIYFYFNTEGTEGQLSPLCCATLLLRLVLILTEIEIPEHCFHSVFVGHRLLAR